MKNMEYCAFIVFHIILPIFSTSYETKIGGYSVKNADFKQFGDNLAGYMRALMGGDRKKRGSLI